MKFLYQFSAGDSFVHRLDPRTKLIFLVCFLVATFLVPQPWIMPLVIIGIIWSLAGISPDTDQQRLRREINRRPSAKRLTHRRKGRPVVAVVVKIDG